MKHQDLWWLVAGGCPAAVMSIVADSGWQTATAMGQIVVAGGWSTAVVSIAVAGGFPTAVHAILVADE